MIFQKAILDERLDWVPARDGWLLGARLLDGRRECGDCGAVVLVGAADGSLDEMVTDRKGEGAMETDGADVLGNSVASGAEQNQSSPS
jgi:hypothetical protein